MKLYKYKTVCLNRKGRDSTLLGKYKNIMVLLVYDKSIFPVTGYSMRRIIRICVATSFRDFELNSPCQSTVKMTERFCYDPGHQPLDIMDMFKCIKLYNNMLFSTYDLLVYFFLIFLLDCSYMMRATQGQILTSPAGSRSRG